ncbi:MAG: hypothetical protein LW650_04270 [Planctomycetaceae bacterium]|jgi:hypothetical protein|nr:hypothetical protein [Phycisphaerales bacterium]MCE2652722.1 hypothetical protein [Planctomycetaceae bacterium]
MMKARCVVCGATLASMAGSSAALEPWSPPPWSIQRVGLFDAQHTGTGPFQRSQVTASGAGGRVIGWAYRFNGSAGTGQSAWTWAAGVNTRLGFTDAAHTATDGTQSSTAVALGSDGRVVGVSLRYVGGPGNWQSAWTWSPGGGLGGDLVRIGLVDATHTASSGGQFSEARGVNGIGRATGVSYRYSGANFNGVSAWTWTASGGTVRIGYADTTHTSTLGMQTSDSVGVSEGGRIAGSSKRYSGTAEFGETAWAWTNTGGLVRIGLIDATHTASNGRQTSRCLKINPAGQIIGTSARYRSVFYAGDSGWVWNPTVGTVRLGLSDAQHTTSAGDQYSTVMHQSNAGRVAGYSLRFDGLADRGRSAWVWSAETGSVRLGLTDAEHTSTLGERYSQANRVGEGGHVAGLSYRYSGTASAGTTGWLAGPDGATSIIGLRDGLHTRDDGYRGCWPNAVNRAGQVIGTSERYNGGSAWLGNSGWYYDPASGVSTALVFSVSTGGNAVTAPTIITDDGWVLGNYMLYSGATQLGYRAFAWSPTRGFADLGSLVDGGLAAHGWSLLFQPVAMLGESSIVGSGVPLGTQPESLGVFILTQQVTACNLADVTGIGGPPSPADGLLTGDDFNAFIAAFASGEGLADITGIGGPPAVPDGLITGDDFNAFIAAFAAGCP